LGGVAKESEVAEVFLEEVPLNLSEAKDVMLEAAKLLRGDLLTRPF
jgi:hypothetical protein